MLDTSRKFFPVATIYKLLDMMASAKLNVFHWHFSDAQAFSVQWKYNSTYVDFEQAGQYYTE